MTAVHISPCTRTLCPLGTRPGGSPLTRPFPRCLCSSPSPPQTLTACRQPEGAPWRPLQQSHHTRPSRAQTHHTRLALILDKLGARAPALFLGPPTLYVCSIHKQAQRWRPTHLRHGRRQGPLCDVQQRLIRLRVHAQVPAVQACTPGQADPPGRECAHHPPPRHAHPDACPGLAARAGVASLGGDGGSSASCTPLVGGTKKHGCSTCQDRSPAAVWSGWVGRMQAW